MAEVTNIYVPQADFVTSTLNGSITSGATSFTIGAGLNLDANGGFLQIDYDSALAVGVDGGPETKAYTGYNTSTGAVSGVTGAQAGTTAVAHSNGANVQCAPSAKYLLNGNVLGYVQVTADQTLTGAAVDLTSLTLTVTIPTGGRRIRISHSLGHQASAAGSNYAAVGIQEDGSTIYTSNFEIAFVGLFANAGIVGFVKTPTAGSHTYKLQAYNAGGIGTLTVKANSGSPSWLMVELI